MRPLAALVLGLALAGCLGSTQKPAGVEETPGASHEAPKATGGPTPIETTTVPVEVVDVDAFRSYSFNLSRLDYQNEMAQFRLVADDLLYVSLDWRIKVAQYGSEDDCAAGAVMSPTSSDPNPRAVGAYSVIWRYRNSAHTVASAGGQNVTIVPELSTVSGGETTAAIKDAWIVAKGQSVIVQLGGRTSSYADGPSGSPASPPVYNLTLNVRGAARVEKMAPVPIRCGLAFYQLEGSTASLKSLPSASVGGKVQLSTKAGSTLLFDHLGETVPSSQSGTVRFLDESRPASKLGPYGRTSPRAGTIGIEIDYWLQPIPTDPAWFMADTLWPKSKLLEQV